MTITTTYTPLTAAPIPTLPKGPVDIPFDLRTLIEHLEKYTIPRFATEAARDAAITSPADGMVVRVADTGLMLRSGSVWVRISLDTDVTPRILGSAGNGTDDSSSTVGSWEQIVPAPGTSVSVVVPSGVPASMRLRLEATFEISVSEISNTRAWFYGDGAVMSGPTAARVLNPTPGQYYLNTISDLFSVPSPGTHLYSLRILNAEAGSWSFTYGRMIVSLV